MRCQSRGMLTMPYEEFDMSPNENMNSVAISSRSKGPPAITVRAVNVDVAMAATNAQRVFNSLTEMYDNWWKQRQEAGVEVEEGA